MAASYFAILAEMRTGSNTLEERLNAIPGLSCHGEVFNPHFVGHSNQESLFGITRDARDYDPIAMIDRMRHETKALAGFRLFGGHDLRVWDHVLTDRACAKVILTRRPVESYVSLKIARSTNQWWLGDGRKAKSARVRFDRAEFAAYLSETMAQRARIRRALQTSGQVAYEIDFEEVSDPEVVAGLARYLGLKDAPAPGRLKGKVQNPQPLSEKVENYEDMVAALAEFDAFDAGRLPDFEPARGPNVPSYLAGEEAPLVFLPIKAGPVSEVAAWLAAANSVELGDLRTGFTQKSLRQWKRARPGHRSFTVVSHPLSRAYRAFADHISGYGQQTYSEIRAQLRNDYGLGLPDDGGLPADDHDAWRHAFHGFLQFLAKNLGGQTTIRVDAAWASQEAVLRGFSGFSLPDRVLRAEGLAMGLDSLAQEVGETAPDWAGMQNPPVPLAAIYDGTLEKAARVAYQRDYMMFGYRHWDSSPD